MMQLCHSQRCPEWAQWRVRKPTSRIVRDKAISSDGKVTWEEKEIKGWEIIALLCGTHKQEQRAMPENKELCFDFVGVAPTWH